MTTIKLVPIKPKRDLFNVPAYRKAIENAGNESAMAVQVDYLVTAKTWNHKPDFNIKHTTGQFVWVISTKDEIYGYVSLGTKPHIIVPRKAGGRLRFFRTGFRPKSRIDWIGSNKGAKATKDLTIAKLVHHPGTKARNFAKVIKKKWDKEWPRQLDRAMRAVAEYGGK